MSRRNLRHLNRPLLAIVLRTLLLSATFGAMVGGAHADAQQRPLPCAVAGTGSAKRAEALCKALGQELKRTVVVVDDGSKVSRGEAVHIIRGDVDWLVIWLRNGSTRAFTRVSAAAASGKEALFLARASRALMQEAAATDAEECVRVEPNGRVPMRAPELAYPWVELKRCRLHTIDVLDPWWVPPPQAQ